MISLLVPCITYSRHRGHEFLGASSIVRARRPLVLFHLGIAFNKSSITRTRDLERVLLQILFLEAREIVRN